jgi:hypothetical protein
LGERFLPPTPVGFEYEVDVWSGGTAQAEQSGKLVVIVQSPDESRHVTMSIRVGLSVAPIAIVRGKKLAPEAETA